jgi:hypothetical protein
MPICPTCCDAADARASAEEHCDAAACCCQHRTDRYGETTKENS